MFSNMIWRLSSLTKKGCLLDCLDWIPNRGLMLACRVMWHVAFGFTIPVKSFLKFIWHFLSFKLFFTKISLLF